MSKSVYSLVLSDEVVDAVDRAAYRAGKSRSAYINSVLADAVSYVTPEKRMNDIFSAVEQLMDGGMFRIMPRPSESAFALRSALQFRYKPVIRYSIELYRSFGSSFGRLKVSLRTQSDALITVFGRFIGLWVQLERQYIWKHFPDGISYELDSGKFTRAFCLPSDKHELSDDEIAGALSGYIKMFDEIIKLYFLEPDDPDKAEKLVRQRYEEYISDKMNII